MEDELTFQNDGTTSELAYAVQLYLDERFPGFWIGRQEPFERQHRSPDLIPLDSLVWRNLKSGEYDFLLRH